MKKIKEYLKKEWIFYATGLFSGMSVMAVELGAQRLLSPYFSASQIVWTIVIGVIMISMALGNILGGKMADKQNKPDRLFVWIFVAATWIMLVPLFGKFVISGVALVLATFVTKKYLIWASLVSCVLVFVFPLMILGMVTPNIVKFATKNLDTNGKIVGKIEAYNTIGSIIGTFIPTFVSIPFVGTSWTFVIFAGILYVVCLIYFLLRKRFVIRSSIILILCLAIGVASSFIKVAFWDDRIIYEGESVYNYIRVEENDKSIIFSTNVLFGVQSVKMKKKGLTYNYYDYAMAAPIIAGVFDRPLDVLILGLGTGTYASQCFEYFGRENLSFDGVEIDERVVDIAKEYFDLPEAVNVFVEDGRAYLNNNDKKYDVIMVDAYRDISIPFQMSSVEFFKSVRSHLNAGGCMVVNMNMYADTTGSITDYLEGTIRSVFSDVVTVKTRGSNKELFAADYDVLTALSENKNDIEQADLFGMALYIEENSVPVSPSDYILTDDKAPVEYLGMQVLDATISAELSDIRESIKGKTLGELIEMLASGRFL
ncbi:MAG: fused MFS/spermidine synthase [Clostridia bacterium]|nr:fused MFS/spermidine synthase [Clostridia bacterium]